MRSWALAAVLPVVVLGAGLGATLVPASDEPRAATAASFATFERDNSRTTVSNPSPNEVTVYPDEQRAVWNHCCSGGGWKVAYDWIVPHILLTDDQAEVELSLTVSNVNPEQRLYFQMSMLAPDKAEALGVQYPDKKSDGKVVKFPISASYESSDELKIIIREIGGAEITYVYKRAKTPAFGSTTKPMPPPGESVKTSSPEAIPPKARRTETSVTNSSGNLTNTTVVADGEGGTAGEAVAACWLIGPDALNLPEKIGAYTRAKIVADFADYDRRIEEARKKGDVETVNELTQRRFIGCLALVEDLGKKASGSSTAAANGCQATRLQVIVKRNRRGRATGLKVVRRKPGKREVRYSCGPSGPGAITITADGRRRGGLRAGLGKKLDFGVVRERGAESDSGRLAFRFGV
jgi:hypothetical protein